MEKRRRYRYHVVTHQGTRIILLPRNLKEDIKEKTPWPRYPTLQLLLGVGIDALVVLGREHNIVLELQLGLGVALEGLKVAEQIVLDGEDGVGLQPGVILGVELGSAALEVGVGDLLSQKLVSTFFLFFFFSVYSFSSLFQDSP